MMLFKRKNSLINENGRLQLDLIKYQMRLLKRLAVQVILKTQNL
jgi:hypothetical protein